MRQECTTCRDYLPKEDFIEGDGKCSFCRKMRAARAERKAKHSNFTTTDYDDMKFVLGVLIGPYDERKFIKGLKNSRQKSNHPFLIYETH